MTATVTDDVWIPADQRELDTFQAKVAGHLAKRVPTVPLSRWEDMMPDIFAISYTNYLEVVANPDKEIIDPEAFLMATCIRRGLDALRNQQKHDSIISTAPAGTSRDSGEFDYADAGTSTEWLETVMAEDPSTVETTSTVAQVIKNDRNNALLGTLAKLPDTQRDIFRRCVLKGQKQTDAAKELGIDPRRVAKRLRKAVAQIAWSITQTSRGLMCEEFEQMTARMSNPNHPRRAEQDAILQHVQECSTCRYAVYESPFAEGLGALLATGAFTTKTAPGFTEKITSLPIIDTPLEAIRSMWDKVSPGAAGGSEAALAGGAAGGTGGTILAIGGGKAVLGLCAGAAATVCVAGVTAGVIPTPKVNAEKEPATKTVEAAATAPVSSDYVDSRAAYETSRASIEQKIERRTEARKAAAKAKAKARAASTSTQPSAAPSSSSTPQQASYSSPVTTSPTTQTQTNESSASQSMGVGGGSTGGSSTSGGGSTGGSTSSAQAQTNQQSASDSFGIGG